MKENAISDIFPLQNSWLLILSLLFCGLSIYFSYTGKHNRSLVGLFFTAFFVRLFMARLDPFLHDWDERFHALVARNMMHDPFKPMLRIADWVPYDYKLWCGNHIWLHKQPLFLWQMALSMKIFGVSEFAIRYPGVLMGSVGVLMIYRISYLMTTNRYIAFIAGLLTCFSYFQLELLSGHFGMDQNDTAFSFYVLASIWAYAEYSHKKTLKYTLLIGVFAGLAILVKWLTGLLVFSGWGIIVLLSIGKADFKKEVINYLIALIVCVTVFLPWQLYIFHAFPTEAKYEYAYNVKHVYEIVEGNSGGWLFYIEHFNLYFGNYLCILLPAGIIIMFIKYGNKLAAAIFINFSIYLIFFSFISTKGEEYFAPELPMGSIYIAVAFFHIISYKKIFKFIYMPAVLFAAMVVFDLSEITRQHDPRHWEEWKIMSYNTQIYKNLRKYLPERVKLVVSAKDEINIMFYNNDIDAYNWFPPKEYEEVKKRHIPVGVCPSPVHQPYGFIVQNDSAFVIPVTIK